MSLRVWLPLNGDLENKGLDDVSATLTGAVAVNDSGKIGKCYQFGTGTGRITLPKTTMTDIKECSVAFWVNILGWQTNWDTFFQAGLGSTPWNNYYFGILRNQGNFLCFSICNGSTSSQGNYKSSNLTLETWYHLTFVYKEGHCLIYINGELDKDYTTTIVPNFSGINYVSIGQLGNASSYQTNCKMNDFRIYDHALSLKEVKEISKGLVLHYPLDNNGFGQENLFKNSDKGISLIGSDYRTVTSRSFNNETGIGEIEVIQENKVWNSWRFGGNDLSISSNILSGSNNTYTFSVDIRVLNYQTGHIRVSFDFRTNNQVHSSTYYILTDKEKDGNWHRVSCSITTGGQADTECLLSISSNSTTISNLGQIIEYKHFKLEEGDKATSWCPNSSDILYTSLGLNDNVIYDCSGYENNGIINGELIVSSDTNKYNISTYIPSATKITHPCPVDKINQEWTCAIWVKLDNTNQTQTLNSFNISNNIVHSANGYPLLYLNGGANDYYNYGNKKVVAGVWTHIAFVFKNSNATKLIYINGINQTNTNGPNKTSTPYGLSDTIDMCSNLSGYISDYRIYTTALSDEDILELYNTQASVDKNNNFYSYSYNELNQGNEIEYMYDFKKNSGNGTFVQDKDGLYLNQQIWVSHDYIPIDPTNKTYKYDIIYSCDEGNLLYIGWERYDANKTSRSNNACTYVISSQVEHNYYRKRGTVDLLTDGVNPCAFIKLRILNKWTGSNNDTNGTATIHYLSLKEYTSETTQNLTPLNITRQGIVNTTEIQ